MAVMLALLFVVFVAVTVADVRERAVYILHLLVLVLLRVAAALYALGASVFSAGFGAPWLELSLGSWGFAALAQQTLVGLGVALLLWLLGLAVSKAVGHESVGRGDVLLIATCCLFLRLGRLEAYLLLASLMGAAMALFWRFVRGSETFPFAPALVWPCWAVLLMAG